MHIFADTPVELNIRMDFQKDRCSLIFRLSHPDAARFHRSFQNLPIVATVHIKLFHPQFFFFVSKTIQRCEILNVCECVHERARACVCMWDIEKKCVHAAEDAGSAEETKRKQSEGKNETKRNCHMERQSRKS